MTVVQLHSLDAQTCRVKAVDCWMFAEQAMQPDERAKIVQIGETWCRIAETFEINDAKLIVKLPSATQLQIDQSRRALRRGRTAENDFMEILREMRETIEESKAILTRIRARHS